jgi:hypothetical protein
VDRLLFQGLSGGVRVDLVRGLTVYGSLGRSDRTGDARTSWNRMYGVQTGSILWTGLKADVRYTRFDSAFGAGHYRSLTFRRQVGESFRFEVTGGEQSYASPFTEQSRAIFLKGNWDWFFGAHYFVGGGVTGYRGACRTTTSIS